jgi:hypothetical protein
MLRFAIRHHNLDAERFIPVTNHIGIEISILTRCIKALLN